MSDQVIIAIIVGVVVLVVAALAMLHPGFANFRAKFLGAEVDARANRGEAKGKGIKAGGKVEITTHSPAGTATGEDIDAAQDVKIRAGDQ